MRRDADRSRKMERWLAWMRLLAVPFAVVEVGLITDDYPPGYEMWGWVATAALAVGAVLFLWLSHRELGPRAQGVLGAAALAFDTCIVYAFVFVYTFEIGTPSWGILYLPVVEGALRYGLVGGAVLPALTLPLLALAEWWRAHEFAPPSYDLDHVALPFGLQVLIGLIVGWLVDRLRRETAVAEAQVARAEELTDQLGRRADQLEAVNRAARALGSSLRSEAAFSAFLREMRGIFSFDRLAVVLVKGDRSEVFAAAGKHEHSVFPLGSTRPIAGSILEEVFAGSQAVVRPDMESDPRHPEERELAAVGLRSRVVAPLVVGSRSIGILSVARESVDAFAPEEVEVVTLLARQVATAVENIRLYEAERSAADELRRLSALRADFVSLVSHELRAPMASVIGCAETLRRRWRELAPDQRESFLELIEGETSRLATLIGDVLDTSQIEAGTFQVRFGRVDVGELVEDIVALVSLGQDEVTLRTDVPPALPPIRGDRERLRQLLLNLVANAVKYTVAGDEVEVNALQDDGTITVSVRDHGPGIGADQQRLIFKKFGRVNVGGKSKPGAGLGLFIARSIAEAHGGTLDVDSQPGAGATFTLRLPAT